MKLSHAWLFLFLPLSGIALAAPEPLLKVVVASPNMPLNGNSHSCTLYGNGRVIIDHTVKLFPSSPSLKSKEIRAVNINVNGIKTVIADAAQGNITSNPIAFYFTHQYFAYQQQDGQAKQIFLLDKVGGQLVNDSPAVGPLTKFIDSVCGDLSLVVYRDLENRAKFSEVILETAGIKAAIDVCTPNNNGFGTVGSAGACDGTPSGDKGVFFALDEVNKQIASTPGSKTASVAMTLFDNTHLAITATAADIDGLKGETYILNGTYDATKASITWITDVASTCKVADIC